MFIIQPDNRIQLTKGDTATMLVEAYDLDDNKYEFKTTDTITLKVKETQNSESTTIEKKANADNIIVFLPSDTSSLTPGLYVYDVQVLTEEGNVYTIVPLNFFEILSEIS